MSRLASLLIIVHASCAAGLVAVPRMPPRAAAASCVRLGQCVRCLEWPPAGIVVTILSGAFILGRPDSALWGLFDDGEETPSDAAQALTAALCRVDGWDLQVDVGTTPVEIDPDERGSAAKLLRELSSGDDEGRGSIPTQRGKAALSLCVLFERERRDGPPRGVVRLLRPSRFFPEGAGTWAVSAVDDELAPTAIEWTLECSGLDVGGETLIPDGTVFFNCAVAADAAGARLAALRSGGDDSASAALRKGRLSIVRSGALSQVTGLAPVRVVGTFEGCVATRRLDAV